ncbi:hypothetical protein KCV00_g86, partial [Aureobasidium melanogenum]
MIVRHLDHGGDGFPLKRVGTFEAGNRIHEFSQCQWTPCADCLFCNLKIVVAVFGTWGGLSGIRPVFLEPEVGGWKWVFIVTSIMGDLLEALVVIVSAVAIGHALCSVALFSTSNTVIEEFRDGERALCGICGIGRVKVRVGKGVLHVFDVVVDINHLAYVLVHLSSYTVNLGLQLLKLSFHLLYTLLTCGGVVIVPSLVTSIRQSLFLAG